MVSLSLMHREVKAVIFVIDSSDKLRIPVAKDELCRLLQHPGMGRVYFAKCFFYILVSIL